MALVTVAVATAPPGPGLDPDAMSYLGAAQWLVHSHTYRIPTSSWSAADTTEPLAHFPPGFSTVIALPVWFGATPLHAARWLVVLAAFCTWTGVVLTVGEAAGVVVAVLTGVATLATPALLNVHLSVLSEPLFLAALVGTLAGLLALARAERSTGARAALATGLAVGAAVMFRYAGIALLGAASLAALTWTVPARRAWRVRATRLVLIVLPTACTLGPWIARTVRLGGPRSVRALGVYGDVLDTARGGLETITTWLVPLGMGPWRTGAAVGLLLAAALATGDAWRRTRGGGAAPAGAQAAAVTPATREATLLRIIALLSGCYLVILIASRMFADPNIPFDERILAPLILLAEIAVAVSVSVWWPGRRRAWRVIVGAGLAAWFVASAVVSGGRVAYALDDGNDFAGSDWRDSPTIAWVRAPSGGGQRALYSNWPAALYFHAHRASHDLPEVVDALALHRFRDRLARSRGVVVGFDTPSPDVATPDTLARALGLRQIARFEDGTVWELGTEARGPIPAAGRPVAPAQRR
jgi:hypothetical protein